MAKPYKSLFLIDYLLFLNYDNPYGSATCNLYNQIIMLSGEDGEFYLKELNELKQEHQDLNDIIDTPDSSVKFSEFTLQKLKKRKLLVKDKIKFIQALLTPDIIA